MFYNKFKITSFTVLVMLLFSASTVFASTTIDLQVSYDDATDSVFISVFPGSSSLSENFVLTWSAQTR
jgi:hypothetical protein